MTELMQYITNNVFRDNVTTYNNNTWHFSQNINYNEELAKKNIFSISLSYFCSSSSSSTLTANTLNYSTAYSFTNTTESTE